MRGLLGSLRIWLFGLGTPIHVNDTPQSITTCLHPRKAWTACTYQLGPFGYYGWFMRCRACLGWFSC